MTYSEMHSCSSDSPWRAPLRHGLEERRDFAQGVGIVADQGMTAGWKDPGNIGNVASKQDFKWRINPKLL